MVQRERIGAPDRGIAPVRKRFGLNAVQVGVDGGVDQRERLAAERTRHPAYVQPVGPRHERRAAERQVVPEVEIDRKSTRLNSSHRCISYAVFCLKKKNKK